MNSDQLNCALKEDKCLNTMITGVFSSDNLPGQVIDYPSAYVCNTDPVTLPGEHWVVFWFQSPLVVEFYDSFGHPPDYYGSDFVDFAEQNAGSCVYNNVSVQNKHSDTCGFHVLYFLLLKCRGISVNEIIAILKKCAYPDQYVFEYVMMHFDCL